MPSPIRVLDPKLYLMASKEANSRRPIYQIHKWWARRLGTVFRALLIESTRGVTDSPISLTDAYYAPSSISGKIVLDPFTGGGTTAVETIRLGGKFVGVEINPVAWFITKKQIEKVDLEVLQKNFRSLESSVGLTIQRFYETTCTLGHAAEITHAIWIRKIKCKDCRNGSLLFRDYLIQDFRGRIAVICPSCLKIFRPHRRGRRSTCPQCKNTFVIAQGVVNKGLFRCPHCANTETIRDACKRYGKPLPTLMVAIEYYCKQCGRKFKSPEESDLARFLYCRRLLSRERHALPYPRARIRTKGRSSPRPISHGYRFYRELFNARQLLSLSILFKEIAKVRDRSIREALLLTFSSCLETNNMLCKYETRYGKVSALFSIPGFHSPERSCENNVWGGRYGRGTFVRSFSRMMRAKSYASESYELVHDEHGKPHRVPTGKPIDAEVVDDFSHLHESERGAMLVCGSSTKLPQIPDSTIDVVLTDPPYFDMISYSELADFFYVWLRLALRESYPWFNPPSSSRHDEMIVNDSPGNDPEKFVQKLTSALSECHRVLKPSGSLVLTFHHNQTGYWVNLAHSLQEAGFAPKHAYVVKAEGVTGYKKPGSILHDICIVCAKSSSTIVSRIPVTTEEVVSETAQVISKLEALNEDPIADAEVLSILAGQSLLAGNATHSPSVSPEQLLSEVRLRLAPNSQKCTAAQTIELC